MQDLDLTQQTTPIGTAEPSTAQWNGGEQPASASLAGTMIVFEGVTKVYDPNVVALNDVSFAIDKGEFVFVVGASGSGKSTTFTVAGDNAYGTLKAERGVHRLVRLSPFDSAHRRQTSFAQVIVSPLLGEHDGEVEVDESDLRVDTYRASGAGGQHVNKTDSAVRLTHLPTGIVVQCQNERSQSSNKQTALRMLRSRLAELREEEREAELAKERGVAQNTGFGSQIRSYVLQPYQLVKDLRTEHETGNTQAVLDGDLDGFVHAYLLAKAAGKIV